MAGTWQRLAHVELSSTADTISSGTFTAKENLRVILYVVPSGTTNARLRFNSDTGSNYADRKQSNGGSDGTVTSQTSIRIGTGVSADQYQINIVDITNIADKEKLVIYESNKSATSAGTAPDRQEGVGKWANTSDSITSIDFINTESSGDFASGTYITVLGASGDTVTDEKTTLTNIPAGTRYEETDTRKIYRRTAGSTALSGFNPEDFSSDNWTEGSCTSISGAKLIASNGHHLGNNLGNGFFTGYKAIGQTLSTNWVLRFKWKTTDMNSNSGNYDGDRVLVGVCEDSYYDNVGDGSVSAKNVIGIALFGSDSAPRFIGYANSGGAGVGWTATPNVNLTTTPATNQIRYFEIIKDGTTVYFNDFGTDNTYTTRVAQNSLTGNSFSNLDTFIVSGFTGNGASQPDVAGELDDVYIYDDTVSVDPEWKERGNA